MDLRKLKKLIDLVQESGISELEVTEGEEKVRIAKHISGHVSYTHLDVYKRQPHILSLMQSVCMCVSSLSWRPIHPASSINRGFRGSTVLFRYSVMKPPSRTLHEVRRRDGCWQDRSLGGRLRTPLSEWR